MGAFLLQKPRSRSHKKDDTSPIFLWLQAEPWQETGFPLNRLIPEGVTIQQLISDEQTYLLQVALISIGLGFSLYVAHKLSRRLLPDKDAAFRAFLPIGAFVFILGTAALWALSSAL